MPLAAGARLGPYEIQSALGAGGMGEVYRARDSRLERDVALKVLPAAALADETARARLVREARLASKLNHPHICTIYDVGESEGRTYVAMELVEGQSLSDRVARGALPIAEVVAYGQQMAGALAHAHAKGVVHRDFKSANVVVTPEGEVKALDFGLAKRLASDELADGTTRSRQSLTEAGVVAGTLAYMAPEQLRGRPADARSDIWALGVVLYELAAGRRPFQGKTGFELSSAILSQPIPAVPASVPAPLAAVIDRCLAKEPGERYQRADDVRAALEALQTGTVAPWMHRRYLIRRRAWPAWVAAALVVVSLLVGFDVGGVRGRLAGTHGIPRIESLAVLPLENLSGDSSQDYFAVGMTEALITDLARLGALKRVTARGSVMRYRGTKLSFAEIARELKVDALITGSVLRSGGLVSLTVQLIDPKTEAQLWTNRYQRELKDVIRLQNDIVAAIVGELKAQLTPDDQVRLASARPVNPDAYDAYLKARDRGQPASPGRTSKRRWSTSASPFRRTRASRSRTSASHRLGYQGPPRLHPAPRGDSGGPSRDRARAGAGRAAGRGLQLQGHPRSSISSGTGRPHEGRGSAPSSSIPMTLKSGSSWPPFRLRWGSPKAPARRSRSHLNPIPTTRSCGTTTVTNC